MHFENISPNLKEEESDSIGLVRLANLEEEEEVARSIDSVSKPSVCLAPPSISEIFHAPRQTLPFNCMTFSASPAVNGSSASHSPASSLSLSAASMVGDVDFGELYPDRHPSSQTQRENHFVRNPVGEIDCLEPLPVNQYSYFRNVSWTEDPAFCNEVFY